MAKNKYLKKINWLWVFTLAPIVYWLYKYFKQEEERKGIVDVMETINFDNLTPQVMHLVIADNLWSYMKNWGTYQDNILSDLSNLNNDDLKMVFVDFGYKNYELLSGSSTWSGFNTARYNLVQILKNESNGWMDDSFRADLEEIWLPTGLW